MNNDANNSWGCAMNLLEKIRYQVLRHPKQGNYRKILSKPYSTSSMLNKYAEVYKANKASWSTVIPQATTTNTLRVAHLNEF